MPSFRPGLVEIHKKFAAKPVGRSQRIGDRSTVCVGVKLSGIAIHLTFFFRLHPETSHSSFVPSRTTCTLLNLRVSSSSEGCHSCHGGAMDLQPQQKHIGHDHGILVLFHTSCFSGSSGFVRSCTVCHSCKTRGPRQNCRTSFPDHFAFWGGPVHLTTQKSTGRANV